MLPDSPYTAAISEYLNLWISDSLNIWISEYLNLWKSEYLNLWISDSPNLWMPPDLLYTAAISESLVFESLNLLISEYPNLWKSESLNLWIPPDSPYTAAISAGVLALQERGTLKVLKIRWWKKLRGGENTFLGHYLFGFILPQFWRKKFLSQRTERSLWSFRIFRSGYNIEQGL